MNGSDALGSFAGAARRGLLEQPRGALQPVGQPIMPGAVQQPEGPSPTRDPPQGGQRRYVRSEILITNNQTGDYGTLAQNLTARFRVSTPSTRLSWLIGWTFQPALTDDATFTLPWQLSADAWVRPELGKGRIMRANNLFTNRLIPTSYEATSGIDEVRGTVVVPASTETSGSGVNPGLLWLTGMWEPAPGYEPTDRELRQLFDVCRVEVSHGIVVSTNGGSGGIIIP